MAGETKTTTAARRKPATAKAAPKIADARDAMSAADLARGILSKEIRSRAVDVQRLAEAVLAAGAKPKKAKKDAPKGTKADGGKTKDKSKDKKKKKLAKIPGQQTKK
jgi:hypothetical protein